MIAEYPDQPATVSFELPFGVAWETLNAVVDRRRMLTHVSADIAAVARLVSAEAILRSALRMAPMPWTEGELAEAWGK